MEGQFRGECRLLGHDQILATGEDGPQSLQGKSLPRHGQAADHIDTFWMLADKTTQAVQYAPGDVFMLRSVQDVGGPASEVLSLRLECPDQLLGVPCRVPVLGGGQVLGVDDLAAAG